MRTKQIGARTYSLSYVYDANGEVTAITYPSGHVAQYQRAADGRVTGVQARVSAAAAPTPLASGIAWLPFGPLASYTQGNGLTLARAYDGNYWLSGVTLSSPSSTLLGLTLTRDPNGRVAAVTDSAATLRNASYGYTDAGRLASASGTWGSDAYTWDANDNRTRADRTVSGTTASDVPTLAPGSNRLAEIRVLRQAQEERKSRACSAAASRSAGAAICLHPLAAEPCSAKREIAENYAIPAVPGFRLSSQDRLHLPDAANPFQLHNHID